MLKELEEALKEYSADDQAAIRPIWEASPALQKKLAEQLKAQADYSRNIQEATRLKAEAEAAKVKADALFASNTEWFRTNNADLERADQLITENTTLKADLEKLKSGAPAPGASQQDLSKYDALFNDINKKLAATEKALKDSQTEVGQRFDAGGMWLLQVGAQARAYEREYNKPFDDVAFVKFMNENKLSDPAKGLELFTAADRQAKWEVDKTAEITKRVEAEQAAKNVPYATGNGAIIEKGPLQYYMERPATGPQNTQQGAVAAAAELASEGKG